MDKFNRHTIEIIDISKKVSDYWEKCRMCNIEGRMKSLFKECIDIHWKNNMPIILDINIFSQNELDIIEAIFCVFINKLGLKNIVSVKRKAVEKVINKVINVDAMSATKDAEYLTNNIENHYINNEKTFH